MYMVGYSVCSLNIYDLFCQSYAKDDITVPFQCSQTKNNALSDIEVLSLAAAVESNSVHPVGKAIVDAARAVNSHDAKVLMSFLDNV